MVTRVLPSGVNAIERPCPTRPKRRSSFPVSISHNRKSQLSETVAKVLPWGETAIAAISFPTRKRTVPSLAKE